MKKYVKINFKPEKSEKKGEFFSGKVKKAKHESLFELCYRNRFAEKSVWWRTSLALEQEWRSISKL